MTENPYTVYDWSIETFGPVTDLFSTVSRAYQEYAELLDIIGDKPASAGHTTTLDGSYAQASDSPARKRMIAHECADVAQILFRAAGGGGLPASWDGASFAGSSTRTALASINRNMGSLLSEFSRDGLPYQRTDTKRYELEEYLYYALSGLDFVCVEETGTTLNEAVQSKMAINRKRKFVGERHVEEAPAEKAQEPLTEEDAHVQFGVVGAANFIVTMSAEIHAIPDAGEWRLDLGNRELTVKDKSPLAGFVGLGLPGFVDAVYRPSQPPVDYLPPFGPAMRFEADGSGAIAGRVVFPGVPPQSPKVEPLTVRGEDRGTIGLTTGSRSNDLGLRTRKQPKSPWAFRFSDIAQL